MEHFMRERFKVFWDKLWGWRCIGIGIGNDAEYSVAVYLWKWMVGFSISRKPKIKQAMVTTEDLSKYNGGRKGV